MAKKKLETKLETKAEPIPELPNEVSELAKLEALHKTLIDMGITAISKLEAMIQQEKSKL